MRLECRMIEYKAARNLRILFVGINPHPGSYRRGVPFSNNKTFWYLLNRAGLLDEKENDLRDDARLKEMYDRRFLPRYRLGFINLVNRPTREVTELQKGEAGPGIERALQTIRRYRPRVVCFIGKITDNRFRGTRDCHYGGQESNGPARIYIAPSGPAALHSGSRTESRQPQSAMTVPQHG
jgi:TDG/mug DNA glycosylase family protein